MLKYLTYAVMLLGVRISTLNGKHCSDFVGPVVIMLDMMACLLWIGSDTIGKSICRSVLMKLLRVPCFLLFMGVLMS
jgi:hypothetical protein